jgi:hypothetical protein
MVNHHFIKSGSIIPLIYVVCDADSECFLICTTKFNNVLSQLGKSLLFFCFLFFFLSFNLIIGILNFCRTLRKRISWQSKPSGT